LILTATHNWVLREILNIQDKQPIG